LIERNLDLFAKEISVWRKANQTQKQVVHVVNISPQKIGEIHSHDRNVTCSQRSRVSSTPGQSFVEQDLALDSLGACDESPGDTASTRLTGRKLPASEIERKNIDA
jgi:hypothetical protein